MRINGINLTKKQAKVLRIAIDSLAVHTEDRIASYETTFSYRDIEIIAVEKGTLRDIRKLQEITAAARPRRKTSIYRPLWLGGGR